MSSPLCFRCAEVIPAGAARAADDVRAVQRLDPGLQVCTRAGSPSICGFYMSLSSCIVCAILQHSRSGQEAASSAQRL